MNKDELKRYVRLPSGKFIDTQKPRNDGLVYVIRNVDGISNWLCLDEKFEESCFGKTVNLQFDTADNIFELVRDDDYVQINDVLFRLQYIDTGYNDNLYIENISNGDTEPLIFYVEVIEAIFTWEDINTLRKVWDKIEGVKE